MIVNRPNYQYEVKENYDGTKNVICEWGDSGCSETIGRNFKNIDKALEFINEYDEKCS